MLLPERGRYQIEKSKENFIIEHTGGLPEPRNRPEHSHKGTPHGSHMETWSKDHQSQHNFKNQKLISHGNLAQHTTSHEVKHIIRVRHQPITLSILKPPHGNHPRRYVTRLKVSKNIKNIFILKYGGITLCIPNLSPAVKIKISTHYRGSKVGHATSKSIKKSSTRDSKRIKTKINLIVQKSAFSKVNSKQNSKMMAASTQYHKSKSFSEVKLHKLLETANYTKHGKNSTNHEFTQPSILHCLTLFGGWVSSLPTATSQIIPNDQIIFNYTSKENLTSLSFTVSVNKRHSNFDNGRKLDDLDNSQPDPLAMMDPFNANATYLEPTENSKRVRNSSLTSNKRQHIEQMDIGMILNVAMPAAKADEETFEWNASLDASPQIDEAEECDLLASETEEGGPSFHDIAHSSLTANAKAGNGNIVKPATTTRHGNVPILDITIKPGAESQGAWEEPRVKFATPVRIDQATEMTQSFLAISDEAAVNLKEMMKDFVYTPLGKPTLYDGVRHGIGKSFKVKKRSDYQGEGSSSYGGSWQTPKTNPYGNKGRRSNRDRQGDDGRQPRNPNQKNIIIAGEKFEGTCYGVVIAPEAYPKRAITSLTFPTIFNIFLEEFNKLKSEGFVSSRTDFKAGTIILFAKSREAARQIIWVTNRIPWTNKGQAKMNAVKINDMIFNPVLLIRTSVKIPVPNLLANLNSSIRQTQGYAEAKLNINSWIQINNPNPSASNRNLLMLIDHESASYFGKPTWQFSAAMGDSKSTAQVLAPPGGKLTTSHFGIYCIFTLFSPTKAGKKHQKFNRRWSTPTTVLSAHGRSSGARIEATQKKTSAITNKCAMTKMLKSQPKLKTSPSSPQPQRGRTSNLIHLSAKLRLRTQDVQSDKPWLMGSSLRPKLMRSPLTMIGCSKTKPMLSSARLRSTEQIPQRKTRTNNPSQWTCEAPLSAKIKVNYHRPLGLKYIYSSITLNYSQTISPPGKFRSYENHCNLNIFVDALGLTSQSKTIVNKNFSAPKTYKTSIGFFKCKYLLKSPNTSKTHHKQPTCGKVYIFFSAQVQANSLGSKAGFPTYSKCPR